MTTNTSNVNNNTNQTYQDALKPNDNKNDHENRTNINISSGTSVRVDAKIDTENSNKLNEKSKLLNKDSSWDDQSANKNIPTYQV